MADTSSKQPIGDPLMSAAQTGVLGGRKPIGTRETPATPAHEQAPVRQPETPAPEPREVGKVGRRPTTRERKKRTVLLEHPISRWLDMQAAFEQREMSDIVAEALELYKKLHPIRPEES